MGKILILGGGRQGRVVGAELAKYHDVTIADIAPVSLSGIASLKADLSNPDNILSILPGFDLAVGALPAALGYKAAQAAIAAKRNYVDLSFFAEDVYALDEAAKQAGVAIVPDCGLAPGISNLVVGRAMATRRPKSIVIEVGGVARDADRPYGYTVTWALSDLVDEYTRDARIRRNGQIVSLPVFSELELKTIEGVGTFESFLTDGCRTLLALDVPNITEKTLRWPGHVAAIKPLLAKNELVSEFTARCQGGDDMVVMRIAVDDEIVSLVDYNQGGMSAMSRTTALTCAAFANYLATHKIGAAGVLAPEFIGSNADAYKFILKNLQAHGIKLDPLFPFLG